MSDNLTADTLPRPMSPHLPTLVVFLVLVVGSGLAIGYFNIPGAWYAGLEKPDFNPPNWIFGPVWTAIYVLIAIAGARTFSRAPKSPAVGLWLGQMALNFAWSPAFFGAEQPLLALFVIVPMLACILSFIAATWKPDRISAFLFIPYAAWVSFATLLNASIVVLN